LVRTAGIDNIQEVCQALLQSGTLEEIAVSPTRKIRLHRLVIGQLCGRIEAVLKRLHQQNPLQSMIERSQLVNCLSLVTNNELINALLETLHDRGHIRLDQRQVGLAGHRPTLSKNEEKLLGELIETYRLAGVQPPTVKECQQQAPKHHEAIAQLIALAAAEGHLVELTKQFYFHADAERQVRQILRDALAGSQGLTLSQIREILDTTRKYAVPLAEHLDRVGFTRRVGDLRVLAAKTD
jgi:selenocysteine-specific elongation factor